MERRQERNGARRGGGLKPKIGGTWTQKWGTCVQFWLQVWGDRNHCRPT